MSTFCDVDSWLRLRLVCVHFRNLLQHDFEQWFTAFSVKRLVRVRDDFVPAIDFYRVLLKPDHQSRINCMIAAWLFCLTQGEMTAMTNVGCRMITTIVPLLTATGLQHAWDVERVYLRHMETCDVGTHDKRYSIPGLLLPAIRRYITTVIYATDIPPTVAISAAANNRIKFTTDTVVRLTSQTEGIPDIYPPCTLPAENHDDLLYNLVWYHPVWTRFRKFMTNQMAMSDRILFCWGDIINIIRASGLRKQVFETVFRKKIAKKVEVTADNLRDVVVGLLCMDGKLPRKLILPFISILGKAHNECMDGSIPSVGDILAKVKYARRLAFHTTSPTIIRTIMGADNHDRKDADANCDVTNSAMGSPMRDVLHAATDDLGAVCACMAIFTAENFHEQRSVMFDKDTRVHKIVPVDGPRNPVTGAVLSINVPPGFKAESLVPIGGIRSYFHSWVGTKSKDKKWRRAMEQAYEISWTHGQYSTDLARYFVGLPGVTIGDIVVVHNHCHKLYGYMPHHRDMLKILKDAIDTLQLATPTLTAKAQRETRVKKRKRTEMTDVDEHIAPCAKKKRTTSIDISSTPRTTHGVGTWDNVSLFLA